MSLTRRDVLAAMLGAPLAAEACKKKKRVPDGELAFRPEVLGHRVRDGAAVQIPGDKWERARVVIVGAGVAGLSAAWTLLDEGVEDFVIVELESEAGGTARSGKNATTGYPWGAHYITAPMQHNADLIALLTRLGLVTGTTKDGEPTFREEHLCREPQERVFADGAWHDGLYLHAGESDHDRAQLVAFRKLIEDLAGARDERGRRAFSVPVASGFTSDAARALDGMTAAAWLDAHGITSPRVRWLVDYACRDDFGAKAEHTSAWAAVHYFASRTRAPGVDPQPVLTWPEGNGYLVRRLLERVRPKLRPTLAAADIVPWEREGARGIDVACLGPPPEARGLRAERVIFAAPQMVARVAIRPYREAPPPHLARIRYGAWMVANLTLRQRPKLEQFHGYASHMLAWDNVLYDSPSLGYVVATHQSGRDHGPTVLTYYYPLCDEDAGAARRKLYGAGREEWVDVALTDLSQAHPDIRDLVERADVVRWGHAMVRPDPGLFFGGALAKAAEPFRGIHFAASDLSGLGLFEEAFFHGRRAALEALGRT